MLSPKYLPLYLLIRARCLAKLCPYIHVSSFVGFTGKKRTKRTPICHANLFLALILLLKDDHSELALEAGWSIIFLIKFAMEKRNRTVVLPCPFLYGQAFCGLVVDFN